MQVIKLFVLASVLSPLSLTAQGNPFALTGGKVKSAYIVYDVTGKNQETAGAVWEIGVAPDRWLMRMVMPFEMGGKKDTVRTITATTQDSQYTYTAMSSQGTQGQVSPVLRPHLAREYEALSGQSKARFRENARLAAGIGGSSDVDAFVTLFGTKTGSETIAGHRCDVYQAGQKTVCVLPGAPLVMLRWADPKQGLVMVAKKVNLNAPIPSATTVLPKGVKWERSEPDDADFITNIWQMKKQSDPSTAKPAAIAKYVVSYLASPQAGTELREMGAGSGAMDEAEETGEAGMDQSEPEN